jgi:MYXO-CTERM domain-containing protein
MDYGSLLKTASSAYDAYSGGGSGGNAQPTSGSGGDSGGASNSGYGSSEKTSLTSGGTNKAAFGAVNFGAGASVGGTSTAEGDAGTGINKMILYIALGLAALLAVFLIIRR